MYERDTINPHSFGFRQAKYGYTALGICVLELTVVWGGIAIFTQGSRVIAPRWAQDVFAAVYFVGLWSIVLSIIGLIKDRFRVIAMYALAIGTANLVLCGVALII